MLRREINEYQGRKTILREASISAGIRSSMGFAEQVGCSRFLRCHPRPHLHQFPLPLVYAQIPTRMNANWSHLMVPANHLQWCWGRRRMNQKWPTFKISWIHIDSQPLVPRRWCLLHSIELHSHTQLHALTKW